MGAYDKIRTMPIKELHRLVTALEEALRRRPEETNHTRHMWQGRLRPTTGIVGKQVLPFNSRPYLQVRKFVSL